MTVAVKRKPKFLLKLLMLVLAVLVVSLFSVAIVLFPSDTLAGFDQLWSWLMQGGTYARRFVTILFSA